MYNAKRLCDINFHIICLALKSSSVFIFYFIPGAIKNSGISDEKSIIYSSSS